jgi:hypothetical protein
MGFLDFIFLRVLCMNFVYVELRRTFGTIRVFRGKFFINLYIVTKYQPNTPPIKYTQKAASHAMAV